MEFDAKKYRELRERGGASAATIDAEIAEMAKVFAEPEATALEPTAMEIKVAKTIVGDDPIALKKHLDNLVAYKRARNSTLVVGKAG